MPPIAAWLTRKKQWLERHNEPGRGAPSGLCDICHSAGTSPVDVSALDGRTFHFNCLQRQFVSSAPAWIRFNEQYPAIKTTLSQLRLSGKPWGGYEGNRTGDCPICLEPSAEGDQQQVWSGCHCYHDRCLVQMLSQTGARCALCRRDIHYIFNFSTGEWSRAREFEQAAREETARAEQV